MTNWGNVRQPRVSEIKKARSIIIRNLEKLNDKYESITVGDASGRIQEGYMNYLDSKLKNGISQKDAEQINFIMQIAIEEMGLNFGYMRSKELSSYLEEDCHEIIWLEGL